MGNYRKLLIKLLSNTHLICCTEIYFLLSCEKAMIYLQMTWYFSWFAFAVPEGSGLAWNKLKILKCGRNIQVEKLIKQLNKYIISSPELKAHCWAYRIGRPLLSIVVHTLWTSFPQIPLAQSVQFHIELLWDGGTKVCSNDLGHMTKMTAMPICGKNLKKNFFSRTKRSMTLKLRMQHRVHEYYHVCSNDDPGLTVTYFKSRSNLVPYAFAWEKVKRFFRTIMVCDIKVGRYSYLNEYINL